MRDYFKRVVKLLFGIFLFSFGIVLTMQANVGLAPWDAFHVGLSNITGMSFGNVVFWVGLIVLLITVLLGEKIGIGTILNVVLSGYFCDLILELRVIPLMESTWLGLVMMIFGLFIISFASYFYISSAFGAGPRDALMIGLKKKLPRVPVGFVRGIIEGAVLLLGWLMGAKIGLGTVIAAFGIAFTIQLTFSAMKFDVDQVQNEDLLDTLRAIKTVRQQ